MTATTYANVVQQRKADLECFAMTRYFFDLRDADGLVLDEEGLLLSSMQAVQLEAAKSLADMARDVIWSSTPVSEHDMSIEVRDDVGPVMKLKFTFGLEKVIQ
ncbi:DUF6894 family protein [Bradyrhizobium viridifuturi]|uniref:DUF6894 family protein n=1 Tax=Bradyrhizobium viridifuturi TaxID=1654716 RepID=UPI0032221F41